MKLNRRNLFLASSATITLTLSTPTLHAGQTWDGGGSNGNWGNATNWDGAGGGVLANFANPITFAGNVTTTNQNNLAANTTVGGINFTNDGSTTARSAAFTLQGTNATTTNSMILGGNITTTASSAAITDIIHASLDIVLNGNRTITTNTSHNLTINGRISETGGNQSITKEGAGVLTIGGNTSLSGGNNTFTGGLIINNGVVQLNGNSTRPRAAGTGTITLGATSGNNTAELRSAGGLNVINDIIVNAGSSGTKTISNRSSNTNVFSGNITANDDLTILGANNGGSFTISGTGSTIASGKTVSFVSTASNGSNFLNSALWSGNGSISYTGNNTYNILINGNKTYSGGTTLGAMAGNATNGHLVVSAGSTFDGNGTLVGGVFGTGTLSIGATRMRTNVANTTIGNAVTFIDNATFVTAAGEKTLIFTGNTSLGNATRILTVDTGSTVTTEFLQFSGQISGTDAAAGITKAGTGNLLLSGNNTFTGNTLVSGGKLTLGSALALQNSAYDTASVAGGLDITGYTTPTFGGLTGSVDLSSALITGYGAISNLTLNPQTGISKTYSGNLGNGDGNMSLTKTGAGTQTLTGNNTYTGNTTINAGTLALSGTGAINGGGNITIDGSGAKFLQTSSVAGTSAITLTQGTLTGNGTVGAVSVADTVNAILSNNNGVAGASLTTGALTFNGNATVNLFSDGVSTSALIAAGALSSNAAGNVTINASATSWTNGSTFNLISYTGGNITGAGFGQFTLGSVSGTIARQSATFGDSGTAITLAISGDTPYWTGANGSNWNLADTNWKLVTAGNNTQFLATDDVLFNDLGGNTTIDIDTANVAPNSVVFNNTTAVDYTIGSTGGFGIASGSLTKNNTGTVTLTGNNTYTGTTTINGGRLIIADGSIASSSNIVNDAALEYNLNANARTYANVISGNGTLTKSGTNTLTLSGLNSFSGNVSVDGGTLLIGVAGGNGTSALGSVANTRTITIGANATLSTEVAGGIFNNNFSFPASGLPGLVINGGLMTNGGNATNSALGNITLAGGTLDATTGSPAGTGSGQGYGSWNLNGTVTSTGNSTISSTATAGIPITLSADTGNGNITTFDVQSGTLTASAVLGQVTRSTATRISGLTKTGDGTMRLTAANTYTGLTTVSGGTLEFGHATNTLEDTAAINVNGGILAIGANSDTVGAVTLTSGSITGSSGVLTGSSYAVQSGNISAKLGGSGGLAKTTAGTVILSGDNSYSGSTTIAASGILRITSGTALGNTTQGVTIASGGVLEIDGTGGAVIVGAEAVSMQGGGIGNTGAIRNIAGDNTWGGAITIVTGSARINSDSGTLLLNSATAVSSGGNRNLVIGGEGNVTIASGIALGIGGAQISKDGNGSLTLSGNNTSNHNSNGGLNINAGNVILGSANALNSTAGSENGVTFGANSTGILNLAGNSVIIRSLNSNAAPGTPVVQNANAANATLTVGNPKNLASTFAGVIQDGSGGGTLSLTKAGTNTLTLSGNNSYSGATTVTQGALVINGAVASTSVVVDGSLQGSGVAASATFSGTGSIDPGSSPGILTGAATDPTAGLDFNFEFGTANALPTWSNASASGSDVLRLTDGSAPFTTTLGGTNTVTIYFNVGSLNLSDVFTGGFYTDKNTDFLSSISSGVFQYFLADVGGNTTYMGGNYTQYTGPYTINVSTFQVANADFSGGNITGGYVSRFTVVPEPRAALLGGLGLLALLRRRRTIA